MVQPFLDIAFPFLVWYNNPFEVIECEDNMQNELIDLQNDNDVTMFMVNIKV